MIRNNKININTSEYWDKINPYSMGSIYSYANKKELMDFLKKHPKGKLIDLGCGNGHQIMSIKKHFPDLDVYGVDISPKLIEYGKDLFKKKGIKGTFIVNDVNNIPLKDYDIIISNHALEHIENVDQIMNRIKDKKIFFELPYKDNIDNHEHINYFDEAFGEKYNLKYKINEATDYWITIQFYRGE